VIFARPQEKNKWFWVSILSQIEYLGTPNQFLFLMFSLVSISSWYNFHMKIFIFKYSLDFHDFFLPKVYLSNQTGYWLSGKSCVLIKGPNHTIILKTMECWIQFHWINKTRVSLLLKGILKFFSMTWVKVTSRGKVILKSNGWLSRKVHFLAKDLTRISLGYLF
jgi:hypothetical protein